MSDAPDPFEFIKAFWNPLGLPMGALATPTLDAGEVEKRIADLKLVENWLNMNLSVLRMSIQALEMQKMSLLAMQASTAPATGAASSPALQAWLDMMQSAVKGSATSPDKPKGP